MSIYDAAIRYAETKTPLVILAGKEYGTGSSRDWAAKGTSLLGVRAVIAESFERIHRSNLIGMGVVPFEFCNGASWEGLGLTGEERVSIAGINDLAPRKTMEAAVTRANSSQITVPILCRIDTDSELNYFKNGGIMQFVLRSLAK